VSAGLILIVVVVAAANVLECLLHPSAAIKKHLFMVIK